MSVEEVQSKKSYIDAMTGELFVLLGHDEQIVKVDPVVPETSEEPAEEPGYLDSLVSTYEDATNFVSYARQASYSQLAADATKYLQENHPDVYKAVQEGALAIKDYVEPTASSLYASVKEYLPSLVTDSVDAAVGALDEGFNYLLGEEKPNQPVVALETPEVQAISKEAPVEIKTVSKVEASSADTGDYSADWTGNRVMSGFLPTLWTPPSVSSNIPEQVAQITASAGEIVKVASQAASQSPEKVASAQTQAADAQVPVVPADQEAQAKTDGPVTRQATVVPTTTTTPVITSSKNVSTNPTGQLAFVGGGVVVTANGAVINSNHGLPVNNPRRVGGATNAEVNANPEVVVASANVNVKQKTGDRNSATEKVFPVASNTVREQVKNLETSVSGQVPTQTVASGSSVIITNNNNPSTFAGGSIAAAGQNNLKEVAQTTTQEDKKTSLKDSDMRVGSANNSGGSNTGGNPNQSNQNQASEVAYGDTDENLGDDFSIDYNDEIYTSSIPTHQPAVFI